MKKRLRRASIQFLTLGLLIALGVPGVVQAQPVAVVPNLGAHAGEGMRADNFISNVKSNSAAMEGNDRNVIDGNTTTFVRHHNEIVTFTFEFKSPVSIRMMRIFTDIVDDAEVTFYSGDNNVASITVSQPFQSDDADGQEKEFYVLRHNGSARVDRVDVTLDYYSDEDDTRHRLYYVDFLISGSANSLQLTNGESHEGSLQGSVKVATMYGELQLNAADVTSVRRGPSVFQFRLRNGSVLSGIPSGALSFKKSSGGNVSADWSQVLGYNAGVAGQMNLSSGQLVLHLKNEDALVVQPVRLTGRAIDMRTLETVQVAMSKITNMAFSATPNALVANTNEYGEILLSRDAQLEVKFDNKNLSFACTEIQSMDNQISTTTEGGGLENVTQ